MKMDSKTGRWSFFFLGIIQLITGLSISLTAISMHVFPKGHELLLLAVAVMSFCLAYLSPQFQQNDERIKKIKEKGMFYSYFFIIGYMFVLMIIVQRNETFLNTYQAICILASLTIMTVFLSFVVLAKRY
ncbi:hypothetical protein [Metabacillus fastidiosus]|uniref:hypothetical protein n=1 Tax=Metabacillus fastidiosus TaxID=1458 RepID=UPI000824DAE1|nr:hypothetical protein [Metabacillus fastidiosus]MED4463675.1 hypothetical protein [Metabacillus fastidiosus]